MLIEQRERVRRLETIAEKQVSEIDQQRESVRRFFHGTVEVLTTALEAKDPYSEGHSRRVTRYALRLAHAVGFSSEELKEMELGGLLHEVGKIGVPDAVLAKEGALTDEEFVEIKKHPARGAAIVSRMSDVSPIIVQCVRSHHERWDGTGYPDGLKGEDIPLPGRILAIADAFDAMTSARSYRPTRTVRQALEQIEQNAGTQFDPHLSEKWLALMNYPHGFSGNILVIDGNSTIHQMFEDILLPFGHRVVATATGSYALRCIRNEPIDLIYFDANVTELDGQETLAEIKHCRPDAFTVVLTGVSDDARVQQMLESGAAHCLTKPFTAQKLADVTTELLKRCL